MKKTFKFVAVLLALIVVFVTLIMPASAEMVTRKKTPAGETITWTERSGPDKGKTFSYTIPESERSWYAMAPFLMIGILVAGMVAFALLNSHKNPGVIRTLDLIEERRQKEQQK